MSNLLKKYLFIGLIILSSLAPSTCWSAIYVRSGGADDIPWSLPAAQFLDLSDTSRMELIKNKIIIIDIKGKIEKNDSKYFAQVIRQFEQDHSEFGKRPELGTSWVWPFIELNSEGGSVLEAINIAKSIRRSRQMRGKSVTLLGRKCYSSCVIILAASYKKNCCGGGRVAIHRPYFIDGENIEWGHTDLQEAYNALYEELSILFRQWNISSSLIDDMFQVPSSKLRLLSENELDQYGLSRDDLVVDEENNMRMRTTCGKVFSNWELYSDDDGKKCLKKMYPILNKIRAKK